MLAGEVLHEAGVIAVRHKADILAVVLAGVDEMLLFRDLTHFGLVQPPQRQAHMGQLLLGQVIEHIALILALVQPLFSSQRPVASSCSTRA